MKSLAVLAALAACGHPSAPARRDAAVARDAAMIELPTRPIGMADLSAFGWRKRAGHAAFRTARKAEEQGDWPAVVAACQAALAADPDHLDAAWLYAIALAKTGRLAEVVEPLALAVAGDPGKWATRSLEHPALAAFLATPVGQAWRRHVERDLPGFVAALSRALVVGAGGDLYAYAPDTARWFRLTRTLGGVVGALAVPAAHRVAYVVREQIKHETRTSVGTIDLATGHTLRPAELAMCARPVIVAYSAATPAAIWIDSCGWNQLDDDGKLHALPAKTARPGGAWLDLGPHGVRGHHPPVASVSADWDDQALASAIRIGTSGRVVSAPAGLIDGDSAAWSPDRAHLAFVAQLDGRCKPGASSAAAFVVDAATGAITELERAVGGLALEWVSERRIAIAGDRGVTIAELGGGAPTPLTGATELTTPRRRPRCSPDADLATAPDDEGGDDTDSGGGTPTDATLPHAADF